MLCADQAAFYKGRDQMNKIAMITGAGSGVGRAVANTLAAGGWSLALVGRKQDALQETAKALKGDHLVAPTDVGDPAQVKAVFAMLKDKFRAPEHALVQQLPAWARPPFPWKSRPSSNGRRW